MADMDDTTRQWQTARLVSCLEMSDLFPDVLERRRWRRLRIRVVGGHCVHDEVERSSGL